MELEEEAEEKNIIKSNSGRHQTAQNSLTSRERYGAFSICRIECFALMK